MPILVPTFPTPTYIGNIFSCTAIIIDAYSPVNYVPINNQLCGHLSGLDSKLGQLTASLSNISCTTVNVNTFVPSFYDPATNVLCAHLQAIDVSFGNMDVFAPQTFAHQLFTDGDNGTFTANITGMTASAGLTLSQDNTIRHEISGSSLKGTSTATSSKTISHTNGIAVLLGKGYEFSTYVFIPAAAFPNAAVVSITTTGTGSVRIVNSVTVSAGIAGSWKKISTRYYPNTNQTINITISITGFTIATSLNFDNLVVAVNPTMQGTQLAQNYFTTVSDTADAFNRIADNFVSEGATLTTNALSLSFDISKSVFWLDGLVDYANLTTLLATANSDNYLFYDSFNDVYVIKAVAIAATQPLTNDGELILWKITTDFVGVIQTTDIRNLSPFGSIFIADGSITTIKLANAAVTDAKMSTTGVTPGSYIFTNLTVNAQGRITATSSPVVLTSPKNNNFLQYDAGTAKWINTANATLEADSATLVNNGFLNSPLVRLIGYYDSDAGAPIVATSVLGTINLVVSSTVPDSRLAFNIGSELMSLTNVGLLGIGTIVPTAKVHIIATGGVNTFQADTYLFVTDIGNVGIGTSTFGASAVGVFAMFNATAPTTSPADTVQTWAQDIEGIALRSGWYNRSESGHIHALGDYHYFGDPSVNSTIRIGESSGEFIFQKRIAAVWTPYPVSNPVVSNNLTATALTVAGIGADEVLMTYTLPANMLNTNGDRLHIRAIFTTAANVNNKIVKIKIPNTNFIHTTTTSNDSIIFDVWVERISATTYQAQGYIIANSASKPITFSDSTPLTWSSTALLQVTGQSAVAAGDITAEQMVVEIHKIAI